MIKTIDGVTWRNAVRNKDDFLFPVKAMAIVFRVKFLQGLVKLINDKRVQPQARSFKPDINHLYSKDWVVYAKKPFGGPQQVIEYLGRYTHKVAITNNRINEVNMDTDTVTFDYKDYSDLNQIKELKLSAIAFIRRFEQHILPKYFTKIRSYGYLSNRNRKTNVSTILIYMKLPPHPPIVKIPWHIRLLEKFKIAYNQCPHCLQATLFLVATSYEGDLIQDD